MRAEIKSQIKKVRQKIPSTFHDKEELVGYFFSLLTLFVPCFAEEPFESLIENVETSGRELFGEDICRELEESYPVLQDLIVSDAKNIFEQDPAAKSLEEVFLCYPGFLAIATHRIAHALSDLKIELMPRVLSEFAHQMTGIDIHPGAIIGKNFFIDHGTGVVIGETCIIGDNVKIFQGVTLGALSVKKSLASTKRHPTIESNVVIYANATLLGPITIGEGSMIGGNVWIDTSVPAKSKVLKQEDGDYSI